MQPIAAWNWACVKTFKLLKYVSAYDIKFMKKNLGCKCTTSQKWLLLTFRQRVKTFLIQAYSYFFFSLGFHFWFDDKWSKEIVFFLAFVGWCSKNCLLFKVILYVVIYLIGYQCNIGYVMYCHSTYLQFDIHMYFINVWLRMNEHWAYIIQFLK